MEPEGSKESERIANNLVETCKWTLKECRQRNKEGKNGWGGKSFVETNSRRAPFSAHFQKKKRKYQDVKKRLAISSGGALLVWFFYFIVCFFVCLIFYVYAFIQTYWLLRKLFNRPSSAGNYQKTNKLLNIWVGNGNHGMITEKDLDVFRRVAIIHWNRAVAETEIIFYELFSLLGK